MRDPNLHAAFFKTAKHYNKQHNVYFGTEHSVFNKSPSTSITEVIAALRRTQSPSLCTSCRMRVSHRSQSPDPTAWRWSPTAMHHVNSKFHRVLLALGGGKKIQNQTKTTKTVTLTQYFDLSCYFISSKSLLLYVHCAHFQNHYVINSKH